MEGELEKLDHYRLIPRLLNESGSFKGRTTFSKSGLPRIMAKSFVTTVLASSLNSDIKAQYDRLRAAGKTKMQALGAAIRKLIQICFGVLLNIKLNISHK